MSIIDNLNIRSIFIYLFLKHVCQKVIRVDSKGMPFSLQ